MVELNARRAREGLDPVAPEVRRTKLLLYIRCPWCGVIHALDLERIKTIGDVEGAHVPAGCRAGAGRQFVAVSRETYRRLASEE